MSSLANILKTTGIIVFTIMVVETLTAFSQTSIDPGLTFEVQKLTKENYGKYTAIHMEVDNSTGKDIVEFEAVVTVTWIIPEEMREEADSDVRFGAEGAYSIRYGKNKKYEGTIETNESVEFFKYVKGYSKACNAGLPTFHKLSNLYFVFDVFHVTYADGTTWEKPISQ